jgi:anti-sigma regulatory factor (Ser/Thr protein kinase)
MDLKELILNTIKKHSQVKTADIAGLTGFSRVYVHRVLKQLVDDGIVILMGKANQAHYVLSSDKVRSIKTGQKRIHRILNNKNLSEDTVLREIKAQSAIFHGLAGNISSIVDYAFTEMLNNAIEHSASKIIDVIVMRAAKDIMFTVTDRGVGIYNNIMKKKHLRTTIDAVQDLLKGKETTAPQAHSGEGIFFTSRIADRLTIKSFEKKLVFDNIGEDIYVKDIQPVKGTRVDFVVNLQSKKNLADLFSKYTDESFQFSKTGVKVKLYHQDVDYVSRSQARRILMGLEKFKAVELDFRGVKTIGQAFADEVFRIWQPVHKDVKFVIKDANENIMFMIRRAQS